MQPCFTIRKCSTGVLNSYWNFERVFELLSVYYSNQIAHDVACHRHCLQNLFHYLSYKKGHNKGILDLARKHMKLESSMKIHSCHLRLF